MAISLLNIFKRKWFSRSVLNGEAIDSNMLAALDAEQADVIESNNRLVLLLRQITTPAGTLRYSLTQAPSFIATASQTSFTVPTYDNVNDIVYAFTDSNVPANGLTMISPGSVTKTSATVISVPAQNAGAQVVFAVFNVGNGTSQLASTSVNQGASLVGINDAGAYLTATTVEGALQEIAANLQNPSYLGGILVMTQYTKHDGSVAFTGDQSMGGHKLTSLANGTNPGDAVNFEQLQAVVTQQTSFSISYLKTDGSNAMAAALDLGTHKIVNMVNGTAANDGVNKSQLDLKLDLVGGTLSGPLDMTSHAIHNVTDPVSSLDAANKEYVDGAVATAQGSRVLGGSGIDGAWTDANVPATPGIYEPTSITYASPHTFPYATILRVNGNVSIASVITVGTAPKIAKDVASIAVQRPSVYADAPFPVMQAGIGGDGQSSFATVGSGAGVYGNGGTSTPGFLGLGWGTNWSRFWAITSLVRVGGNGGSGDVSPVKTNAAGTGGAGGGGIIILVNGNLTMTGGTIDVSGAAGGSHDSGGGGGSILIVCNGTITGGTYDANGGAGGNNSAGCYGGGGGRVTLVASVFAGSRTGNVAAGASPGAGTGVSTNPQNGLYEEITLTAAQIAALFDR